MDTFIYLSYPKTKFRNLKSDNCILQFMKPHISIHLQSNLFANGCCFFLSLCGCDSSRPPVTEQRGSLIYAVYTNVGILVYIINSELQNSTSAQVQACTHTHKEHAHAYTSHTHIAIYV